MTSHRRDAAQGAGTRLAGSPRQDDQPPSRQKPAETDGHRPPGNDPRRRYPPDSIPNPLPGVDPQQTPGVDHPPAENE